MDQVKLLQEKARIFHGILQQYAKKDDHASMVLGFMANLFDSIERGDIVPPMHDDYRWHFANTESPLFKYDDLGEAHAQYSHALEGWANKS
ncbi:hypothetical protein [Cupriavidus sp. D384]|uniref:hypothetical protein n=1 Tax=Cupriavidus sp. D384 TaxID=1538095 RepID=UPI00082B786A|nr:hypothetical protein [Cupriavidus sp. D384]